MSINQANVFGDNNIVNEISIDVGRLQKILLYEKDKIIILLNKLSDDLKDAEIDNDFIGIVDKNKKNDLSDFYAEFIKSKESKLEVIAKFIADNDLLESIDRASKNLKIFIFSHENKKNHVLSSNIFNILIQEHTKKLEEDDKDIMILFLYFLYRHCYIGAK